MLTAQANNVKNLETPEDKLGWMFDAFDADGGGTVDRYIYIYRYLHVHTISIYYLSTIYRPWIGTRSPTLWWGCSGWAA